MINRMFGTSARLVQLMASQPVTFSQVSKTARGLLTTMQHTLTVFGLSAVAVLALLYTNPDAAKKVSELLYPESGAPAAAGITVAAVTTTTAPAAIEKAAAPAPVKAAANSKQQQHVTSWLAKRYRVAGDAANMLVSTAYTTAHEMKIDPLLILAVMAIESGLNPFAESPMGAKGLMQVMAKVHHDKFAQEGGAKAALDPVANIRVGARILKDYVKRTGSVEGGLKTYVGAADMADDSGYGAKVIAEYRRLKQVASGKNVPTRTPPSAPTQMMVKAQPAPSAPAPAAEPKAEAPAAAEHTEVLAANM